MVDGKKPSETIQVTGGLLSFSVLRRLRNGDKKFFTRDSRSKGRSWRVSISERPSGIVSYRKSGNPSRELGPRDLRKRLWLYSVLIKVM